jgi:hypothetical protein
MAFVRDCGDISEDDQDKWDHFREADFAGLIQIGVASSLETRHSEHKPTNSSPSFESVSNRSELIAHALVGDALVSAHLLADLRLRAWCAS